MVGEEPHRCPDAVGNRDPRLPSERFHARGVEVHEGAVAQPPALAPRRSQPDIAEAELVNDDPREVEHVQELVVAEVEHVLGPAGGLESGRALFTTYLLPFEVTSILLLIAILGAVVLASKEI